MGLRKEKEVMGRSSGKADLSGESGLAYRVFSDTSPDDYVPVQNGMKLKQLTAQLIQKSNELERLRDYVTKLEEGENGLVQELTRQLATKDEEVSRIAALFAKKEAENRRLSTAFEAHIISEKENAERIKVLLLKKEHDTAGQTERLRQEVERKDAEITSLRNSLIRSRILSRAELPENNPAHTKQIELEHLQKKLEGKETDANKLQMALLEEQKLGRATQSKLKEQLAEMEDQVEELKILLADKQRIVQNLQSEFEKSSYHAAVAAEKPGRSQRSQPEALKEELERKNKEIARLERSFLEEQNLNKSVQSRLKEQIASTTSQLEELKSFLIEKEKFVQNLEAAFEKRIAAKEEEMRHLQAAIEHKPKTNLHHEVDRLRSELQIKEEASAMMAEEMAKMKEQSALIRKRLEERQKIFSESERAYEELIGKLREQHDSRAKALIQEAAQKEVALSSTLEEERAKMRKESALMKEKEKQIAETLQAFTRTSEQLIKLGSAGQIGDASIGIEIEAMPERQKQLEERAKYLEDKENELRSLLSSTEARIAELKSKEAEVERKEQFLLQEHEGFNRELDVLANAGIEIGKSKQYLQQKLDQIGSFSQTARASQSIPQRQPLMPRRPAAQPLKPQPIKQQPSVQEMGFGAPGAVQEAQEEEQFETPRFTGIATAPTQVQEAATELSDEEGMAEAPKAAATAKPAEKTPKISKAQQKKLAKKLELAAKAAAKAKLQGIVAKKAAKPLHQQKPASLRQQTAPTTETPQKEMLIGARDADSHTGQELFTEISGYSEVDEIRSIVEVGLQHGDSLEQIQESLLVSGYSKKNIDKVLGSIKK